MALPTAALGQMSGWARGKKAAPVFIDLAPIFYEAAAKAGVDPVAAYAQAAKETAYGRFGGGLDTSFCNTCGLKTKQGGADSDKNAHARFNSWREGVTAHIDHLALYAGAPGYPKAGSPDPRQFFEVFGKAKFVEDLGGAWAPASEYGLEIVKLMKEIESVKTASEIAAPKEDLNMPLELRIRGLEAALTPKRYKTISEVPQWATEAIKALIAKGAFADPENLDLSCDMVRVFVVLQAAGMNGVK
jgi:hypothetical protein